MQKYLKFKALNTNISKEKTRDTSRLALQSQLHRKYPIIYVTYSMFFIFYMHVTRKTFPH